MADPKLIFVCATMTASDKSLGQPFTGECGRWLYRKCLRPLGLKRVDVGLVSLDSGKVPTSDGQIIVAVGKPAASAIGDAATVRIPHPLAVSKRKDTGETERKMHVVKSLLQGNEDAQAQWEHEWPAFVPPTGGKYAYQVHKNGDYQHHDLRMTSKGDGHLWGWTIHDGPSTPKDLHPSEWLTVNKRLPDGSEMTIEATGEYTVGVCTNSMCELFLNGLTKDEQPTRVVIKSTGKNESGVTLWASEIPKDQTPIQESKSLAEITSEIAEDEKLIYGGELITAGSVQKRMDTKIIKSEPNKRIVYGIVWDPYMVDAEDDWTPPGEIEKAAHDYMTGSRAIDFMHEVIDKDSVLVESWVEQYPSREDYLAALDCKPHKIVKRQFGDDTIHSGAWGVGVKLSAPLWELYKKGELNAFSPLGSCKRQRIDKQAMPRVEVIDATKDN